MTLPAAGTLAALLLAAAPAHDPVFDVPAILAAPLEARVLKTSEADAIVTEEVTFFSETDGATRVEIFAFFSYPKGAHRLPAYVWNQGGGARADARVTQDGARRGYATLCIDLPMPGYRSTGGYPIVDGPTLPADARTAPIAHGAVALLRAVSFLASRPEVDPARIAMAGSSWGGFFATLQAGLDPRLRAAASMFGAGRLDLGNPWWDERGRQAPVDAATRERWRVSLDPALRLPHAKVPIAWFSGTNDQFYWMPSLTRTFEDAGAPKRLVLAANWNHALPAALDAELFAWLDANLKGGPALPEAGELVVAPASGSAGHALRFTATAPGRLVSAEFLVSAGEAGHWANRCWTTLPATLADGVAQATLPASGLPLWVSGSAVDERGFRVSTALATIEPRPGHAAAGPGCDGAASWGDFESAAEDYLTRQGLKVPAWSADAASGQRSATMTGNVSYPLSYTAGVPHRFRCKVKSETDAELRVRLVGRFDGAPLQAETRVSVGPRWSDVSLDLTPPQSVTGHLTAMFQVPQGAKVLVDAASFRPLPGSTP